jgi:hypothetical protein
MTPLPEHLSTAGRTLLDRGGFLSNSATALGSIALTNLLGLDGLLAANGPSIDPGRPYAHDNRISRRRQRTSSSSSAPVR